MSIPDTKYEMRNARCEKGAVLLFTLIVMIALTSVVGAYLGLVRSSTRSTGAQISDSQAIYLADAGLQYAIYRLADSDYRGNVGRDENNPTTGSANLGEGSYAFEIHRGALETADEDTFYITSTGTADDLSRQITESVTVTPAVFERAIHGDGNHDVKFDNSAGTITGNVSCVKNVKPDSLPTGLTVTGTVTDKDSTPPEPTTSASIPLGADTTYYNLANAEGHLDMDHDIKFTTAGTYTGTWYSGKRIKIEASNVTINGVLVAEGAIEFKKGVTDIVINPKAHYTTQNYPALIAGDKIDAKVDKKHGGLQNSTISGLVYAEGNIEFNNTTNITFNGTIIGLKRIELKDGTNVMVTYDADIFTPPIPGFTYTTGDVTVTPQNDWNEI